MFTARAPLLRAALLRTTEQSNPEVGIDQIVRKGRT